MRRLLDGSGNGFVVDQTADYLPDGIHLVKLVLTMTLQGTTTVRTLRASEGMLLPTGAAPGTSQSFALTGSGIGGQETASVTGPGSATVGGATVATVGLKMVLTLSGGATGTIEWDQAFAPAFRLPAAESASASVAVGPVTVDLHYHCALQRPPA
ncbi:MAG: hypothetical protein JO086_09760 [Acidimicrobiia bacterium]|nr:hypothetical protein [Acidimicrobiia bacterium]